MSLSVVENEDLCLEITIKWLVEPRPSLLNKITQKLKSCDLT
jgi:hypothetical protein